MRTISIAIKTKDEEYADALAMALARNIKGLDIDVPGGDPAGYDVVLTDAAYSADGHMSCSNGNAIFLTDSLDEDENHVYRYGNVMRIAEAVIKTSNAAEDALRADNDPRQMLQTFSGHSPHLSDMRYASMPSSIFQ